MSPISGIFAATGPLTFTSPESARTRLSSAATSTRANEAAHDSDMSTIHGRVSELSRTLEDAQAVFESLRTGSRTVGTGEAVSASALDIDPSPRISTLDSTEEVNTVPPGTYQGRRANRMSKIMGRRAPTTLDAEATADLMDLTNAIFERGLRSSDGADIKHDMVGSMLDNDDGLLGLMNARGGQHRDRHAPQHRGRRGLPAHPRLNPPEDQSTPASP